MPDFVEWLLATQLTRDTAIGDLARDLKHDRCLPPEARTPEAVLAHMTGYRHHACREAVQTCRTAARRWRAVTAKQEH